MGWIVSESAGLVCPDFADVLVGCEITKGLETLGKVVGVEKGFEVFSDLAMWREQLCDLNRAGKDRQLDREWNWPRFVAQPKGSAGKCSSICGAPVSGRSSEGTNERTTIVAAKPPRYDPNNLLQS